MVQINNPVFQGSQAGKAIFTGTMTAQEMVEMLRAQTFSVNENAQRSLVVGANKIATNDLLQADTVEKMPRMIGFRNFIDRLLAQLEKNDNSMGFFGAVQFTVPAAFTLATVEQVGESKVVMFKANPMMGETALHIGDGQGRIVGFHSAVKVVEKMIMKLKAQLQSLDRKGEDTSHVEHEIKELDEKLKALRKFLSTTDISFVIYADKVDTEGNVTGVSLDGERRLYLEANALNAQAAQQDMVKYEGFSPVILSLQDLRTDPGMPWLNAGYIEEDAKSISKSSNKLFTLSTLAQAYSLSMINDSKVLKALDAKVMDEVEAREEFVHSFWKKVGSLFQNLWISDPQQSKTERLEYLHRNRDNDKNVVFSAIFLQALGQLCFRLGRSNSWDASLFDFSILEKISPLSLDYRAANSGKTGTDGKWIVTKWNDRWTNALMKGNEDGTHFAFNNVTDSITKTRNILLDALDLAPGFEG